MTKLSTMYKLDLIRQYTKDYSDLDYIKLTCGLLEYIKKIQPNAFIWSDYELGGAICNTKNTITKRGI